MEMTGFAIWHVQAVTVHQGTIASTANASHARLAQFSERMGTVTRNAAVHQRTAEATPAATTASASHAQQELFWGPTTNAI